MKVETFKTNVIVLIGSFIVCLMSPWPMIFSIRDRLFVATDNITWWDQRSNVQITD